MRYVNLLLDADDTLFDFPKASARAFSRMCQLHDIPDTPDVYQLYHQINLELWNAFDRGDVTKEFVTLERYVRFFDALHLKRDVLPATGITWQHWGNVSIRSPMRKMSAERLSAAGTGCTSSPTRWPLCRGTVCGAVRLPISSPMRSSPKTPERPNQPGPITTMSLPASREPAPKTRWR